MFILLLLGCMVSGGVSTEMHLCSSTPNSSIIIPLMKLHPYSCELIYFKVQDYDFNATIRKIPDQFTQAHMVFILSEHHNLSRAGEVVNGSIRFNFNLKESSFVPKNQSIEIRVEFDLHLLQPNATTVVEKRKTYLIFPAKDEEFYKVKLPIMAIAITQLIGLLCILVLPMNVRYRRFLPFTYNICISLIYIGILVVALYLQMIFSDSELVYQIQRIVVGLFSYACLILYSQDLLCFVIDNKIATMVIAMSFSTAVMYCDELLPQLQDSWFLNNIIAVMVAGAFIKFVIIRRLKTAIWALGVMWVFFWLREFAVYWGLQKYDQGTGIRIVPLFLQVPHLFDVDSEATYACSAFGSSKIISFGIVLNYCKRVDLYLSTHFYRKLGWALATFCVFFELIYNIVHDDVPTMEVMGVILFYPLAIVLMLFFANKRGEWAQIWHGSFYDMAVNRASIPRQVSFENMQRSFGEDLLINKGSDIE